MIYYIFVWQRGGMVTQRIANPCIPVRFRALPPKKSVVLDIKKSKFFFYSSVAQLVEQLTVNQLVAGSSPARGAKFYPTLEICELIFKFFENLIFWSSVNSE